MKTNNGNLASEALIKTLISYLPFAGDGDISEKAIQTIRSTLNETSIEVNADGKPVFDHRFWRSLFNALAKKDGKLRSEGTQRRAINSLKEIALIWYENDFIDEIPPLDFLLKSHRKGVVSLDGFYNIQRNMFIRASDQQTLVEVIVGSITQQKPWPAQIMKEVANDGAIKEDTLLGLLGLLLALSGGCSEQIAADLLYWKWSDVLVSTDLPVKRPRHEGMGYIWFWLARIVRGVMLSVYYRNRKQFNPNKYIFYPNISSEPRVDKIEKCINASLKLWCDYAKVPKLQFRDVVALTKYVIYQEDMPNAYLSAMFGAFDVRPIPEDQMKRFLSLERKWEPSIITGKKVHHLINRGGQDVVAEIAEDDSIYEEYFSILESIQNELAEMLNEQHPKQAAMALWKWISENKDSDSVPIRNVMFIVLWLLDMENKKDLKVGSRATYWYAVQRILREFPDLLLTEITEDDIIEFIQEEFARSTYLLTKKALRMLITFLDEKEFAVQKIEWDNIHVHSDDKPVRILFDEDVRFMIEVLDLKVYPEIGEKLRESIGETNFKSLRTAVNLAYWFGLRVSEVCRLHPEDFYFLKKDDSYVNVRRSKRGKSRRETTAHLEDNEFIELKKIVDDALKNHPGEFLFRDEDDFPFDSKWLSSQIGRLLEMLGISNPGLEGRPVHFHNLRKAGAERVLTHYDGDIRFVSIQLGHSVVWTTIENYLHTLDLRAVQVMKKWNNPLNDPNAYIPIVVVHQLMGVKTEYVSTLIKEFNKGETQKPIHKLDDPPDREYKPGPGIRPMYISSDDLNRLLVWAIGK